MIRTVIADDEPLAREGLRLLLRDEPDVEIVGEAEDGPAAVRITLATRPELLLLDIQMPGMSGLAVTEAIATTYLPAIIFVTAWDRYAVRAFEVHALDYLVKPVTADRLRDALWRARRQESPGVAAHRIANLLASPDRTPSDRIRTRFPVRDGNHYVLLRSDEIDWIEAQANYVRLHAGPRSFLLRGTLADFEREADPSRFVRIHRSSVVNVDRVARITPDSHGDFEVLLTSGQKLRMTRTYRDRLI